MAPVAVGVLAAAYLLTACSAGPQTTPDTPATSAGSAPVSPPTGSSGPRLAPYLLPAASSPGHLSAGSDPSTLPGPILIADKLNDRLLIVDPQGRTRWQFPQPGDLATGQTFKIPDDAFFTSDGSQIIATEEDDYVIRVIDVATHQIRYEYGTPGVPGFGPNQLDNPDDAMMLPNRDIVSADIKNCRIIVITQGEHRVSRQLGQVGRCRHDPPRTFGSPNGAFPLANGRFLVTEINGSWVSEVGLDGQVAWSVHLPSVAYPSDSNEVAANRYLTVDYSRPGQILEFDRSGRILWRYAPTGGAALNKPSLALPLPNGDILANDDANHRVIVVDPRTNTIVWQYGHTGLPGTADGYLNNPDGVDLYPPNSLLVMHAAS